MIENQTWKCFCSKNLCSNLIFKPWEISLQSRVIGPTMVAYLLHLEIHQKFKSTSISMKLMLLEAHLRKKISKIQNNLIIWHWGLSFQNQEIQISKAANLVTLNNLSKNIFNSKSSKPWLVWKLKIRGMCLKNNSLSKA